MICTPIPGGFVCGARGTRRQCSGCRNHAAFACDYPVQRRVPNASKTCDRAICERCKTTQEDGRDFCPPHQRLLKENTNGVR